MTTEEKLVDIKKACEAVTFLTRLAFRRRNVSFYIDKCPLTGETLTPENAVIEQYDLIFDEVVDKWIHKIGLDVIFNDLVRAGSGVRFPSDYADAFLKFNSRNTHFRAIARKSDSPLVKFRDIAVKRHGKRWL